MLKSRFDSYGNCISCCRKKFEAGPAAYKVRHTSRNPVCIHQNHGNGKDLSDSQPSKACLIHSSTSYSVQNAARFTQSSDIFARKTTIPDRYDRYDIVKNQGEVSLHRIVTQDCIQKLNMEPESCGWKTIFLLGRELFKGYVNLLGGI